MKSRCLQFLFALILCLIFSGGVAFAEDQGSVSASLTIKVDRVANLQDRLFERITSFFKFSNQDKYSYQKTLTEKRLAELKYITDNNQGDQLEELSSRYSTYLGQLTELVLKNQMKDKKQELLDMYSNHLQVLEELAKSYDSNTGLGMLMQHDINYVKIYSGQINDLK